MPPKTGPVRKADRRSFAYVVGLCLVLLVGGEVLAQSETNQSGLALPRFVTTRSQPVNVRVGPGTRYDIAWVFLKAGVPVEIIQEFDNWRKIRDVNGAEGWVYQNLLIGNRAGIIVPVAPEKQAALRDSGSNDGRVRAWLEAGFQIELHSCDGAWCAVTATVQTDDRRGPTYAGYVRQADIWGAYLGERFE